MITAPFQAAAKVIRLFSASLAPLLQAWPQLSASDPGAVAVLRTLIDGALDAAQRRYQAVAKPFRWTFTRADLHQLLTKLATSAEIARPAA
jgi:hypothetical protein